MSEVDCWVPGEGPIPCKWMIIGEAPGPEECEAGKPFIGDAGKFLREALEGCDAHPGLIRITNTVKIFPGRHQTGERKGKIKAPSHEQIRSGFPLLRHEILEVKPVLILALGVPAIKTLTGCRTVEAARAKAARTRGRIPLLAVFDHEAQVVPTWHPSYIKGRGKKYDPSWRDDIGRFV